jgi:catechol 2,3-dioxygenase-like lactoylglutathione lyase family enzyme
MRVLGIGWLGTRTDKFNEMANFAIDIMGMTPARHTDEHVVFHLPDGDEFQIFSANNPGLPYDDQPVAAFLVEDVVAAREELEEKGVVFIGEIEQAGSFAWTYFRAPDGRVYELTHRV